MSRRKRSADGRSSIQQFIRRYVFVLTAPLIALLVCSMLFQFYSNGQYTKQLNNVITASAFNQSFKETIDLKMYYYVADSRYSEGLPLEEVEDAKELAQDLLTTTTARDSRKAISNVLTLCDNLESKILQISETESYDEQQSQLEDNIYILTSLVQEYMSNYLYYESVELNEAHESMEHQLRMELAAVIILTVTVTSLVMYHSLRFGRSLSQPLETLCDRVHEIGEGNLDAKDPVPTDLSEIRMLSTGFEQMVAQLREQIEKRQKEGEQLRKTEFSLLQAQINPHFLYNTLDTIICLEETGETERSIEMVTNLSSYFRTSLSKGRDVITLAEELTHVHSYLDIQQVRYQDILDYELTSEPELSEVIIPKLTLQPLVENALYHGIKLRRGKGCIQVRCVRDGDDVRITVTDNGAGMTPERLAELRENLNGNRRTGFGFVAVHERLRLYFGAPYGLAVESALGRGTTVTVLLPFTGKGEEP